MLGCGKITNLLKLPFRLKILIVDSTHSYSFSHCRRSPLCWKFSCLPHTYSYSKILQLPFTLFSQTVCLSHGTECIGHARQPIRESQEWICLHLHNTAITRTGEHIQLAPILYGFWGVNSENVATYWLTQEGTTGWWNYSKSPIEPQSTSQASNILTSLLFGISTLAGQSFNETSSTALPHQLPFAFSMGVHFTSVKKNHFFCFHLNSPQHKMNDYNISFSLSLLSNTEPALSLQSVCQKTYHN